MQAWIITMMERFGYIGMAGLIALENIFPPIPSEVILTFGGFLTTYAGLNVWMAVAAATLGSLIGAIFLYGVGWSLTPQQLKHLLEGKWGKLLHLYPADVEKAIGWFQKKGKATVFFCRFVPVIRSLISIPAGFARMGLLSFLGLTAAGSVIWNSVLIWLGAAAGSSWEQVVVYAESAGMVVKAALVISAAVLGVILLKRRPSA